MPLSRPVERQPLHTRRVECRGYRREDGLWDIEGHIVDTKTYSFSSIDHGEVAAGEPVHDMWIRLTVDRDLVIQDVEAVTDAAPFHVCPRITPAFAKLKGVRIAPGFTMKVRGLLGGVNGCTHIVELLGPVATTAFQTLSAERRKDMASGKRPPHIDSCHALASNSEVVKRRWPQFYTGS